jgi:hypothetical protein
MYLIMCSQVVIDFELDSSIHFSATVVHNDHFSCWVFCFFKVVVFNMEVFLSMNQLLYFFWNHYI